MQLRRLGDHTQQRREQATISKIKAHVRKDDGRMQAYGWSLPAKAATASGSTHISSAAGGISGNSRSGEGTQNENTPTKAGASVPLPTRHLPVPVPIYCRPFMEQAPGMKIFCASGVDLSGGKKGEFSRTYSSPHVWICTATHPASRVTIIDANRPADVILSFEVCPSHLLCIAAVPGLKEDDFRPEEGIPENPVEDGPSIPAGKTGVLSYVRAATLIDQTERRRSKSMTTLQAQQQSDNSVDGETVDGNCISTTATSESKTETALETDSIAEDESASEKHSLATTTSASIAQEGNDGLVDNMATVIPPEEEIFMSSVQPTMWLGAQSGFVYVHSAVAQWERCLHKVRLSDSVLSIT